MKRYKKKEILETADLLIEGNNYITNNYQKGSAENIIEVLAQSQEMAILLGNCLETFGDSGIALVSVLEDYCEKIYQFSQSISDEFVCRKIAKATTKLLVNLKVNIIDQIPDDKIEMVFLPYKASMWDSLESVWRAAEEDPECNAYVVPIPYFEKNAQGELAVMHYEGNQFPKDVPVVHYMDYNLAERRPDVAFIHNPYDQYNYVTSVHPAYYVPELKKYVNKVIYVPYYISPEAPPESLEIQKQKKGFAMTVGVMQSDMVFLQSENMKRLYINILEKNIQNVKKDYWEKKIFGLGSPKLDRVHKVKRDDSRLSAKWYSLIYSETGNRKKVIFYNISLSDLLNQENMMEKIEDTLHFFEKSNEYVIWWRPHPLYEPTLSSMRPDLLMIYRSIVEDFKRKGYGIFDEGEDLEWAIAETDAYYGDSSSVVELFIEAGKPVLYQDTRVKNSAESEKDILIWPCAFCVDEDDIWLVHGKMNIFMRYCISENTTNIIGTVPNEVMIHERLYSAIYKWGNKIFLIPLHAREIAIYYIDEGKFDKIPIANSDEYENRILFCTAYTIGKYLYCIPGFYDSILKINMESNEVEYILIKENKDLYLNDSTRIGNTIIAVYSNSYLNHVLFFDMESKVVSIKKLGASNRKYSTLTNIGDDLYLFDIESRCIIRIRGEDYKEEEFYNISCAWGIMGQVSPGLILFDPEGTQGLLIMNTAGEIIYEMKEKKECIQKDSLHYSGLKSSNNISNEIFYYFSGYTYTILQFNKGMLKKQFFLKLDLTEYHKLQNLVGTASQMEFTENAIYGLVSWIEDLKRYDKQEERIQRNYGKDIMEAVKNQINEKGERL